MRSRKQFVELIRSGMIRLSDLSYKWRCDYEIVLAGMETAGNDFKDVSRNLKNNKVVVLAALDFNGCHAVLRQTSEDLKDDEEVIKKALSNSPFALTHASERLRNAKDLALIALNNTATAYADPPVGEILECLSESLRDDKDVVLNAVEKSDGEVVKYASDRLKNDSDIALEVVGKYGDSFKYLNPTVLMRYSVREKLIEHFSKHDHGWPFAPEYIRSDKALALEAVRNNPSNFEYVSTDLRSSKEVVMAALSGGRGKKIDSKLVIRYASYELRNDKEVVRRAIINGSYDVLEFTSEKIRDNEEFMRWAIGGDKRSTGTYYGSAEAFKFASSRLRNDEALLRLVFQKNYIGIGELFKYASFRIRDNKKIVNDFMEKGVLKYASVRLRRNKALMLRAMKFDISVLEAAPKELQQDLELKNLWIRGFHRGKLGVIRGAYSIPSFLRDDKSVMLAAVKQNGELLELASARLKDNKEVVLEAISNSGKAIAFISNRLRNNKEVAMKATAENSTNLVYVSERLKNDVDILVNSIKKVKREDRTGKWWVTSGSLPIDNRDFLLRAVRRDGELLAFAPPEMKADREVVLAAVINFPQMVDEASKELKNDPVIKYASEFWLRSFNDIPDFYLKEREFAIAAVSHVPSLYSRLSESFKDDEDILLAAISGDFSSVGSDDVLRYASARLRDNEKVVRANLLNGSYRPVIESASARLRSKRRIAILAIKLNPENLQFVSVSLQDDLVLVKLAIKEVPTMLKWASVRLRNDKKLVTMAVANDWRALEFASESIKDDPEILVAALNQSYYALDFASSRLQNHFEFITNVKDRYISHIDSTSGRQPRSIPKVLVDDRSLVIKALSQVSCGYYVVRLLPEILRDDFEIMKVAVKTDGSSFKYASERLRSDKRLLLLALQTSSEVINYTTEKLRNDYHVKQAFWDIKDEEREIMRDQDQKQEYYRSLHEDSDNCPACQENPCMCSDPF